MERILDLNELRKGYQANDRAKSSLVRSGLAVVGNELAGSGKDALIREIIDLPGSNFGFVPSRKTRKKREGEILGVDFVRSPIAQAVKQVQAGNYVEWEPLRGTEINGTHMRELLKGIKKGVRPIKDVEPKGQVSLRELNPDLKAVYPLPDLEYWLEMLKNREDLPGANLKAFVGGDFGPRDLPEYIQDQSWFEYAEGLADKRKDITSRLGVAANQWEVVWELGLHKEPNTLFIVNEYGNLMHTATLAKSFIENGRTLQHTASPQCIQGEQVLEYLGVVEDLARDVLLAA